MRNSLPPRRTARPNGSVGFCLCSGGCRKCRNAEGVPEEPNQTPTWPTQGHTPLLDAQKMGAPSRVTAGMSKQPSTMAVSRVYGPDRPREGHPLANTTGRGKNLPDPKPHPRPRVIRSDRPAADISTSGYRENHRPPSSHARDWLGEVQDSLAIPLGRLKLPTSEDFVHGLLAGASLIAALSFILHSLG
jgi:hypothetical protein